jgi:hypothetical protein
MKLDGGDSVHRWTGRNSEVSVPNNYQFYIYF